MVFLQDGSEHGNAPSVKWAFRAVYLLGPIWVWALPHAVYLDFGNRILRDFHANMVLSLFVLCSYVLHARLQNLLVHITRINMHGGSEETGNLSALKDECIGVCTNRANGKSILSRIY